MSEILKPNPGEFGLNEPKPNTGVIPDIIVCAPCDAEETRKCTLAAAKYKGPVYFRFAREKTPVITTKKTPFEFGKAYVCREGYDVTLIACGPLLHEALQAAEELAKQHIEAEVINSHTIKPLDGKTIQTSLKKTACAVTIEEHQITGGLYGAVAEYCAQNIPVLHQEDSSARTCPTKSCLAGSRPISRQ